eukprot:gene4845-3474_t
MIGRFVVLGLTLLGVANAHICMWSPVQRNGFSIDTPGESLCYLKEGPCGGVPSASPITKLTGGQEFSIAFQQNLNHFYIENPGRLVADFAEKADPAEEDFTALGLPVADYNAMNEITQTNFTIKVQIPNVECKHCVIRLRYVSQNPTENDRGMTFYQCADVKVVKSTEVVKPAAAPAKPVVPTNATSLDCCAPAQFTLEGYEVSTWRGNPTTKKFYFDAKNKLFRVDTNSGKGVTPKDGTFQMISNFTSGIEYYYNVATGSCALYGLNYWSDWCYGSVNKQTYKGSFGVGSETANAWVQDGTPFVWAATQNTCVPISQVRSDTGETTFFFNMKEGAPDASVFEVPAACKRAEAELTDRKALPSAPAHLKHF